MSVRISAHDWVDGGITPADAVQIARACKDAGADLIDCSSGQVSARQKPTYGRMYQTPFADRIRQEAGIATIAVGAISEADKAQMHVLTGTYKARRPKDALWFHTGSPIAQSDDIRSLGNTTSLPIEYKQMAHPAVLLSRGVG